eukprot:TRINITY_DN7490_c0_g1_i4.p1 TRINITY_DN7490_c0_g1~~TRINITY_DN7490_c0_g1_i4.p1  ORF type:complete len:1093 (-),score=251.77 TRINITY_DN7490_c0_g1_i4:18-3296(-)
MKSYVRGRFVLLMMLFITTLLSGCILFSSGFFPKKTLLTGHATAADIPPSIVYDGESFPSPTRTSIPTSSFHMNASTSSPPPHPTPEDPNIIVPKYERLVLMVVDAFRSSFLFKNDSSMHFTKSVLQSGRAKGFVARAAPPTVTLPRIKALMSGGLPSFMDFMANFFSSEITEDSLPYQMHASGLKMAFYGDDTWLKLFPDLFYRHDGTTSFFVSDTVEVDHNVTRHLARELVSEDWQVLILHYLGLDHIGHLAGANSPLMRPKQREMDAVIERIYKAVVLPDTYPLDQWGDVEGVDIHNATIEKPTLFVVCSDHGMTDAGNHGGSSDAETSAVLVFMSPFFTSHDRTASPGVEGADCGEGNHDEDAEPKEVIQTGLVPTLSLLFGLPIPLNSMGALIPDVFPPTTHTREEFLRALEINSMQLRRVLQTHPLFWDSARDLPTPRVAPLLELLDRAQERHASAVLTPSRNDHFFEEASQYYQQFMMGTAEQLKRLLTTYDNYLLIAGMIQIVAATCALGLLLAALLLHKADVRARHFNVSRIWAMSGAGASGLWSAHLRLVCPQVDSALCADSEWAMVPLCCALFSLTLLFALDLAWFLVSNGGLEEPRLVPVQEKGPKEDPRRAPLAYRMAVVAVLAGGTLLHLASLGGSSLVEEEHQTWYFLTSTLLVVHIIHSLAEWITSGVPQTSQAHRQNALRYTALLACMRVMRNWNQTGVKWLTPAPTARPVVGAIDYARWLTQPTIVPHTVHLALGWGAVLIPCAVAYRLVWQERFYMGVRAARIFRLVSVLCGVLVITYKWDYLTRQLWAPLWVARIAYACILALLTIAVTYPFWKEEEQEREGQRVSSGDVLSRITRMLLITPSLTLIPVTLFLTLLHKTYNMFLCTIMGVIAYLYLGTLQEGTRLVSEDVRKRGLSPRNGAANKMVVAATIELSWLSNSMFFMFGNSNSLSTIDISGAYTGVATYSPGMVGALTFFIGFTGPFFFFVVALIYFGRLARWRSPRYARKIFVWYLLLYCATRASLRAAEVLIFVVVTVAMREHLFLWSVFSPKLMYELFWTGLLVFECVLCLLIAIYLIGLNYVLERRKPPKDQ